MVVVQRVDVDNGYAPLGPALTKRVKLVLNQLDEDYWAPHLRFLG